MADLELSLAMALYDRVEPLLTGEVKPDGITLRRADTGGGGDWARQLEDNADDVAEMSFSFMLRAIGLGWGYRMLPVFHNRNFAYTATVVRLESGIRVGHPEDLKGKRVGLPDYQMSAALWTKGILHHEFGVKPEDVEWFAGRPDPFIPGEEKPFSPPPGVTLHPQPNDINVMLMEGKLDAIFSQGRVPRELSDPQRFSPLFPDAQQEASRYFKKTGIFPAHHATIVRESILREHPWVATSLLNAFNEAKKIAMQRFAQRAPSLMIFFNQALAQQRAAFGEDPYAYGLQASAKAIEAVQTFSYEQGLTQRKLPLEELIAEEVLHAEEQAPSPA
jgi:4,5-dihydroxyphthalate decarboxylase